MYRLAACVGCLLAVPALAAAQGVVVVGYPPAVYAPAPVVTAYYAPTPVTTHYAPAPVTAYYAPSPVVAAYYAPPAVGYYAGPTVTTYRYPLLRPRTTVVRTYPGTVYYAP
jgi:hypothetical protein